MSLRRFYRRIESEDVIQQIFFILNTPTEDDCIICFDEIKNIENVACHKCNKPIHLSCIERWFNTNNLRTCPHCRSNWKFEIDIIDRQIPIYIQLDDYSEIRNYRQNRLIVRGSISGPILDQ